MYDKVADREFFFKNPAHQPASIGARGAWTAGGLEFNWTPGFLGHSAFTEDRVWVGKLQAALGGILTILSALYLLSLTAWSTTLLALSVMPGVPL